MCGTVSVSYTHLDVYKRQVVLLKILDELLRSAWKLKLLRTSLKLNQLLNQLLFGRFLAEFNEYRCCMSVEDRNTYTPVSYTNQDVYKRQGNHLS